MSRQHRNKGPASHARRQETAQASAEARENRTPQQQLELLDQRLGEEIGAVKERLRLREHLSRQAEESSKGGKVDRRKSERGTEGGEKSERVRERSKDRRKSERGRSRAGRRESR